MSADLAGIRGALATNLTSISGLRESAYIHANIPLPAAEVEPSAIDYDLAMARGLDELTLTVRVLVGSPTEIGSQKKLDAFLAGSGATSIKAALESDKTLGGAANDLHVTSSSGYRLYERNGAPVLGAEWTVQVIAS